MYQLKELAANATKKSNAIQQSWLLQIDFFKKTALLDSYLKESEKEGKGGAVLKKIHSLIFGNKDVWDRLYQTIDSMYQGFTERCRKQFPHLTDDEFKICCLAIIESSNKDISIFLQCSESNVHKAKNKIRKKLNLPNRGKIETFLLEKIDENHN